MFKCWLVRKSLIEDSSSITLDIFFKKENAVRKARSLRRVLNSAWKVQIVELVPHVIEDFEEPKGIN